MIVINVLLVIALLMAYLSSQNDPNETAIFSFFGLFYPIILMANVGMIAFWVLVKFKYAFISLLAIVLGWSHLTSFVNVSLGSTAQPEELTVVTFNLGGGYHIYSPDKKKRNTQVTAFKAFLSSQTNYDILCFQEVSNFTRGIIKETFPEYHLHTRPRRGTLIASKYPILEHGELNFGTLTNSCLWADIQTPEGKIRVYTSHLQSNQLTVDAEEVLGNPDIQEEKTWSGIINIFKKYGKTSKKRVGQAQMILNHSKSLEFPVLITGDFNEPPSSFVYQEMNAVFKDSFREAGSGIGTTYGGKLPMLRIDYVFGNELIQFKSHRIPKERMSDHFPVVVSFEF